MGTTNGAAVAAYPATSLQPIVDILRKPGGCRLLQPRQRRLLVAAILASIIPCDGKVLDVEVNRFVELLRGKLRFAPEDVGAALQNMNHGLSAEELQLASRHLPELLGTEDRTILIGLLWDLAMCDKELHPLEEQMVFGLAARAEVVHKLVVEELARAARINGR